MATQESFVKRVKFTSMKKVIMFLLLAVITVGMSAVFTSCSSDDDDEPKVETYQLKLKVGETSDYNYLEGLKSENDFVASVNGTQVKALHVGKTVLRSSKAIINVEVYSQYNLFDEPYIKFGGSKNDVKNYEKRTLAEETDTKLIYKSTGSFEYGLAYSFKDNGKLNSVFVMFKHDYSATISSVLGNYFADRYLPISISGNESYFLNNEKDKADVVIFVELFAPNYDGWGQVAYMPYNN